MKKLLIRIHSAYGVKRYYPVCDQSKGICKLMRRKSFTYEQIKWLQEGMNYTIEIITIPEEI
jgi:hypothetical protein